MADAAYQLAAQSLVALVFILAAIQAVILRSAYHGPINPILPPASSNLQR
jgi:hypothetical protein